MIFFGNLNRKYDIKRPFRTCPFRYNVPNYEGNDTISFDFKLEDIKFTDGDFFHYWMYVVDSQHFRHAVHDLWFTFVKVNGTLTVRDDLEIPDRKLTSTAPTKTTSSRTLSAKTAAVTERESFYNVFDD